ncbi:hypothetical protein [Dyella sp.]|uniref:hypothetical protein n=1 Tax=Dyella sp. TaxID=1869338 RepID=UPI002ED22198
MFGSLKLQKCFYRPAAMAGLLALAFATPVLADDSQGGTGLGQSWPNAQDVSSSANYHVYVFVRDGVRYLQVNDAAGQVRGAVAAAGGQFLVLPLGSDASRVSTPQTQAAAAPAGTQAGSTETVYADSASQTKVAVTPLSNGMLLMSTSTCKNPEDCSAVTQPRVQ